MIKEDYKFIHVSDLHLGRQKGEELDRFMVNEAPLLINTLHQETDIDAIVFSGDMFHNLRVANDSVIKFALTLISSLVVKYAGTDTSIIIIKGTDTHDDDMLQIFEHLALLHKSTLRLISEITYIDINGLLVRCIPELKVKNYETFRAKIAVEKADLTFFHGAFSSVLPFIKMQESVHQLDSTVVMHPKDISDYTLIGTFGGHFHKRMKLKDYPIHYGGTYSAYSFDEHDSGFEVISVKPMTNSYTIKYIPNKNAKVFITKEIPEELWIRGIKSLSNYVKGIMRNSSVNDVYRINVSYVETDVVKKELVRILKTGFPSIKFNIRIMKSNTDVMLLEQAKQTNEYMLNESLSLVSKIKEIAKVLHNIDISEDTITTTIN